MTHDLRYALRSLRKSPGTTIIAILILALGIGANTAIFSILDPLLLRTLPVQRPDELVNIGAAGYMRSLELWETQGFHVYRDKNNCFSGVFAFAPQTAYEIDRKNEISTAAGEIVSGNYFSVLGVRPFKGRLFRLEDEQSSPVVVLSFDYWRRAFEADPKIIGQQIPLNDASYTIVGVAPAGFFGMEMGKSPDFYLPLTPTGLTHAEWVHIFGRLKPGFTIEQAQSSLAPLFHEVVRNSSLPQIEIDELMQRIALTNAGRGLSELREKFSLPVQILMGVVGLILLLSCVNVANLLLTRAAVRAKEFSLKQALGASRWRLMQQLLLESFLLILAGTIGGLLIRSWMSSFFLAAISSQRLPFTMPTGFDSRVFVFTLGVLAVVTLVCGLSPAVHATGMELANDLKVQGTSHSGKKQSRFANGLVLFQIAISFTVLFGASLLLRSLVNLETFDAGFDRDHVIVMSMRAQKPSPAGKVAAFNMEFAERARHLPGVRSVSWSAFPPMSDLEYGVNLAIEGYSLRPGENAHSLFSSVSSHYFGTLGIPLMQGRDFAPQDVQIPPHTVIINRSLARRFFGDISPIGKRVQIVEGNHPPMEIIGVVADSKYNDLRESSEPFFYMPSTSALTLEVRATGDPKMLETSLLNLVRFVDASISVATIKTLRAQVDESIHFDRVIAALCGAFGLLALALACIGLYGTLSFRVTQRIKEIGIRMAMGAHRRDILRLVIGQGLGLTAIGVVLGSAGAIAATFLLQSILFHVKRSDPLTLALVPLLLLVAAVLACYIPARRAASVEPMEALRME